MLEIASTPVSDEPPLANEHNRVRIVAPITKPSALCTGTVPGSCAGSYTGRSPNSTRATPTTIVRPTITMKK